MGVHFPSGVGEPVFVNRPSKNIQLVLLSFKSDTLINMCVYSAVPIQRQDENS